MRNQLVFSPVAPGDLVFTAPGSGEPGPPGPEGPPGPPGTSVNVTIEDHAPGVGDVGAVGDLWVVIG